MVVRSRMCRVPLSLMEEAQAMKLYTNKNRVANFEIMFKSLPKIKTIESFKIPKSKKKKIVITGVYEFEM